MSRRLSGINPLAYVGVDPYTPPNLVVEHRSPTVHDNQGYNLGTFWLNTPNPIEIWLLVSLANGIATWVMLFPGGPGGAQQFPTDAGVAIEAGGILNIFGDTRVTTSGAGNTVTIHLSGSVASQFNADVGVAIPAAGILNIFGSGPINTTGAGNTITIHLSGSVTTQYVTDAGIAIPLLGILDVFGGSNINTAGAANVITINLDNNVVIPGTLTILSLGAGVVQTTAGGLFFSNKGTDGQVLISATAGVPIWNNITSLGGTITITNGPNTINLENAGCSGPGGNKAAFFALLSANTGLFPADGTPHTIIFDTVLFDTFGNYNNATGIFTATTTGAYRFSAQVLCNYPAAASSFNFGSIILATTAHNYAGTSFNGTVNGRAITGGFPIYTTISIVVPMTAGDTASIFCTLDDPTFPLTTGRFDGFPSPLIITYFCGNQV